MPNYVRYRIPVKAGKSYYMGGRQTKNAFCAVKFDNDHTTDNLSTFVIDDASTNNAWLSNGSVKDGQQINVKLKRSFSKGKWSPIVLPFSVSESRMREIFGDGVVVLSLDQLYSYSSGFNMPAAVYVKNHGVSAHVMFTRHHYQMLYANTPAYIMPDFTWSKVAGRTDDETTALGNNLDYDDEGQPCKNEITFNRVTFVGGGVKETNIGSGYFVTGSYNATTKTQNGNMYYIDNKFVSDAYQATMYHASDGVPMKGTRCWISRRSGQNAPPLTTIGMGNYDGDTMLEEDYGMSNIVDPVGDVAPNEAWNLDPCVYNLQGMIVGRVEEGTTIQDVLSRLVPGIYIYQGQKVNGYGIK